MNRNAYIDTQGRMIIRPRFYGVCDFYDGVASVMNLSKKSAPDEYRDGYINKAGQLKGVKYFDNDSPKETQWFWQDLGGYSEGAESAANGLEHATIETPLTGEANRIPGVLSGEAPLRNRNCALRPRRKEEVLHRAFSQSTSPSNYAWQLNRA